MSEQEIAKRLKKHLLSKWSGRPCPMCGGGDGDDDIWQIQRYVNLPLHDERGTLDGARKSVPLAAVMCPSCGFTAFVNLKFIEGVADA